MPQAEFTLMQTSPGRYVTCLHPDGHTHEVEMVAVGFPGSPYPGPTVAAGVCPHARHAFYHVVNPKLLAAHKGEAIKLAVETAMAKVNLETLRARQ